MERLTLGCILEKADELGIEYEFNQEDAGFFVVLDDGSFRKISLEELFLL